MVGWHHRLNGQEFEEAPGDGDGRGGLACCDSWGHKESDRTWQPNSSSNPSMGVIPQKEEVIQHSSTYREEATWRQSQRLEGCDHNPGTPGASWGPRIGKGPPEGAQAWASLASSAPRAARGQTAREGPTGAAVCWLPWTHGELGLLPRAPTGSTRSVAGARTQAAETRNRPAFRWTCNAVGWSPWGPRARIGSRPLPAGSLAVLQGLQLGVQRAEATGGRVCGNPL